MYKLYIGVLKVWEDEFDSGELDDEDESHEWDLENLTDSALSSIDSASCPQKWKEIEAYQAAYDYFVDTMCVLVDEFRETDNISEVGRQQLEDAIDAGFEALHLCRKIKAKYPRNELDAEEEELTERMRDVLSIKNRFAETEAEMAEYRLLDKALEKGLDVDMARYLKQVMETYRSVTHELDETYSDVIIHYHGFEEGQSHEITVSQIDNFSDTILLCQKAARIAGELEGLRAGDKWAGERSALMAIMKNVRYARSQILEDPETKVIVDDDFYRSLELGEDE